MANRPSWANAGFRAPVTDGTGRGAAALGYIKLNEGVRKGLGGQPGAANASALDEAALLLTLGASGADLKLLGKNTSKAKADELAKALRDAVVEAAKNSNVAMLGLTDLVKAIKVDTDDTYVRCTLHMSRQQYADLVERATGVVTGMMSQQGP